MEYAQCDRSAEVSRGSSVHPAQEYDNTRNAWGLLIHPLGDGKFVRMGRFKIWAEQGGLQSFKACGWRSVQLL